MLRARRVRREILAIWLLAVIVEAILLTRVIALMRAARSTMAPAIIPLAALWQFLAVIGVALAALAITHLLSREAR
jgi:hypothetical protein